MYMKHSMGYTATIMAGKHACMYCMQDPVLPGPVVIPDQKQVLKQGQEMVTSHSVVGDAIHHLKNILRLTGKQSMVGGLRKPNSRCLQTLHTQKTHTTIVRSS